MLFVRDKLIVFGDATTTANSIMASESLFRIGIVVNLSAQIFSLLLGITLFRLFKDVDKRLATVMLASVCLFVIIAIINLLNNMAALMILTKADYLNVFEPEKRNALMMMFLKLNNEGQGLLEIFWGPFLFTFGLLAIKSRFIPGILGILLIIGSFGYPINSLTSLLIPEYRYPIIFQLTMLFGALGGIPTMFWLLIKGVKNNITTVDKK